MSWPTTIDSAPSGSATTVAKADPMAVATASFSCSGTSPRTSYALMNSDRLGVLTATTLVGADAGCPHFRGPARGGSAVAQDPQVTAPADLDGAGLGGWTGCRPLPGAGPSRLTHRVGQREQVVRAGAGVHELAGQPDDVPASWRGQPLGVGRAQVVGVGFGVGGQRAQHGGLVGVDVGQGRDGTATTRGAGTTTRQAHDGTVVAVPDRRPGTTPYGGAMSSGRPPHAPGATVTVVVPGGRWPGRRSRR